MGFCTSTLAVSALNASAVSASALCASASCCDGTAGEDGAAGLATGKSVVMTSATSTELGITHANQVGLDLQGGCTFETWFRTTKSTAWIYLITKDQSLGLEAYNFHLGVHSAAAMHIELWSDALSSAIEIACGAALALDTWYHLALTRNPVTGEVCGYFNGALVGTVIGDIGEFPIIGHPFRIGRRAQNAQQSLAGQMAETRVWNSIRSEAEIAEFYNRTLVGDEPGLAVYCRFPDDYLDSGPAGNHLSVLVGDAPLFSEDHPF